MSSVDNPFGHIQSQLGSTQLNARQVELIQTMLDPYAKRIVLLRAGQWFNRPELLFASRTELSDTTLAALAVILGVLERRPGARILFLLHDRSDANMVATLLAAGITVDTVDRYRFREMLDATPGRNVWDKTSVSFLTMDFAGEADVQASLTSANWDLVIADGIHMPTDERRAALSRIVAVGKRALLIGKPRYSLAPDLFPKGDVATLEWKLEFYDPGRPAIAVVKSLVKPVRFTLTASELGLWATVGQLIGKLSPGKRQPSKLSNELLHRLRSSPAALEEGLRRATAASPVEYEAFKGRDDDEGQFAPFSQATAKIARPFVESALKQIEEIRNDSKLEAFGALIERLSRPQTRLCILTEYLATVYYLAAELEGRELKHSLFHQHLSETDQFHCQRRYEEGGTILVATRAVTNGPMDLRKVTDLVLYDLPRIPSLLRRAIGEFDKVGRTNGLKVHVVEPGNPLPSVAAPLRALFPKPVQRFV